MAEDTEIKKNVSELNIDDNIFHLVDLDARKMFLRYYDKLYGLRGNKTGVITNGAITIEATMVPENNVFLAYIMNQDASVYRVLLVYRSNSRLRWIELASKNATNLHTGAIMFSMENGSEVPATNGNMGFYCTGYPDSTPPVNHSCIYGLIRLTNFNSNSRAASFEDNRKNSWTELTTHILGHSDNDLVLE